MENENKDNKETDVKKSAGKRTYERPQLRKLVSITITSTGKFDTMESGGAWGPVSQ